MSEYRGKITVPGVLDQPVDVEVNLDDEILSINSGGRELGRWDFDEVQLVGRDVGFDLVINGAPGHLDTNDDGRFANELGMHSAPPRLRRLMLANLNESPFYEASAGMETPRRFWRRFRPSTP